MEKIMYGKAQMIRLDEGVMAFYDNRIKRIVIYDDQVEGSLEHAYDLIGIAREHNTLTRGKYLQFVNLLKEKGLKLTEKDQRKLENQASLLERISA